MGSKFMADAGFICHKALITVIVLRKKMKMHPVEQLHISQAVMHLTFLLGKRYHQFLNQQFTELWHYDIYFSFQ
jgi:hypothetical protein